MALFDGVLPARLAAAVALTVASLLVQIAMAAGVSCGFPEPDWAFVTFLFLFAVGFIWTLSELVQPRLLALPVSLAVYFAVGPVGLAVARTVSDNGDLHEESAWMPFWTVGLFLATELLPGSC